MAQPQVNPRQKDVSRLLREQRFLKGAQLKAQGQQSGRMRVAFQKKGGR